MAETAARASRYWTPHSCVLLVEHRHCHCGAVHTAPGLVRVELHCGSARRTVSLNRLAAEYDPVPTLPRSTEHIHTHVRYCPECWTDAPASQRDLFPNPIPIHMTPEEIELTRKSDLPTWDELG